MQLLRLTALALSHLVTLAAAPAILGVYNVSSVPPDLPNSGVAQGAIFTLYGTGLGPSTALQVESYPLPTTQGLGGTTLQVQVGGVTETCIVIYTSAVQVNAILPSATPVGTGTLTLSYQGASASYAIKVLAANFGTVTLNYAPTGPGVVTDTSYNPITMINPAHPGETLILWGSGLGAVTGNETEPPQQVDLGTGVQVLVGNQPATVTYGGRGSSPGLDQINFVVPAGVSGCKTSVAVTVKGVTGNVTTTSVAPAGQATCGDSYNALTAANLQKAIANGSLNIAGISISRIGGGDDTLLAYFGNFPLNSLIRSYGGSFGPSIGSCLAYEVGGSSLEVALKDPIQPTYLDAGPDLVITAPTGAKTIAATSKGVFETDLAVEPPAYIQPGTFSVANGSGGANVGPFNSSLTLLADIPSGIDPTNIPTSINRAQNLTLTWTPDAAFPVATIFLFNGVLVTASPSLSSYVYILCDADPSAGTFTVPAAFLNLLPANGFGTFTQPGVNISIAGIPEADFTAAGIDAGIFTVFVSNGSVATIQ